MSDLHREWAARQLRAWRGRLAGHSRVAGIYVDQTYCACGWRSEPLALERSRREAFQSHKVGVLAEQARRGEGGM